jgi:predicted component of type VI protein secretion system
MPRPKTYTLDEVMRALQNAAEIASCFGPADWDAFPDRGEATLTIAEASLVLEEVSRVHDVRWGDTHDYYEATERLAPLLVAFPRTPRRDDLVGMAEEAIREAGTLPNGIDR